MSENYTRGGVDIDAGNRFVEMIALLARATRRTEVLADVGGFSGLFQPKLGALHEPVLVASTDGVGTKLKLALELKQLETIGIDLVAMCVNDIACSGAEPLFFLDYFATGKLAPDFHAPIIAGIAIACQQTGMALLGGETAEMPGCYAGTDFDLAGFAVGIVDRAKIIDGRAIRVGQTIIGLAASGFHSNGYSLVRKIVADRKLDLHRPLPGAARPLGEQLLLPTKLYSPVVSALLKECSLSGIAHITGGGFWENIPRILPADVTAVIDRNAWEWPSLFTTLQTAGKISDREMLRVFNCGIGMVLVVPTEQATAVCQRIETHGERAFVIGRIETRATGHAPIVINA